MNNAQILGFLNDYLRGFTFHPQLVEELLSLICGSGFEKRFFRDLVQKLTILRALGVNATQHEEFESIGKRLYSMHMNGAGFNIRILYSFLPDRQPVLLLAFYERAGKNKTDYSGYLEPALSRMRGSQEEH